MAHFGVVCPTATGHLNPMMTLSAELKRRGHCVTFFQLLDLEKKVTQAGFEFRAFGQSDFPAGELARRYQTLGELSGLKALRCLVSIVRDRSRAALSDIPHQAKKEGIDFWIVDQVGLEGGTIAEWLKTPFVTVANALILNQANAVPPFFRTWPYRKGLKARLKNTIAYRLFKPHPAGPP